LDILLGNRQPAGRQFTFRTLKHDHLFEQSDAVGLKQQIDYAVPRDRSPINAGYSGTIRFGRVEHPAPFMHLASRRCDAPRRVILPGTGDLDSALGLWPAADEHR
ncbi:MAG: hypothetical protein GY842_11190, partial [bacterium]|nr:hypothetical protein [bacterium]